MNAFQAELVPLREVAALLAYPVSLTTLYYWASHGCRGVRLKTTRVGNRHYVRPSDLEKFSAAMNRQDGRDE